MSIWKRDGSGWRARIGVLSHEDLTVSESEFWTMTPDGVSLAKLPLQCIVYAFTAGNLNS